MYHLTWITVNFLNRNDFYISWSVKIINEGNRKYIGKNSNFEIKRVFTLDTCIKRLCDFKQMVNLAGVLPSYKYPLVTNPHGLPWIYKDKHCFFFTKRSCCILTNVCIIHAVKLDSFTSFLETYTTMKHSNLKKISWCQVKDVKKKSIETNDNWKQRILHTTSSPLSS